MSTIIIQCLQDFCRSVPEGYYIMSPRFLWVNTWMTLLYNVTKISVGQLLNNSVIHFSIIILLFVTHFVTLAFILILKLNKGNGSNPRSSSTP